MDENCLFCKIIVGKIPSAQVYENEDVLAFLDINQSAPGHSMVIHKKHGYSIFEYNEEELGKIMMGVQIVAKKIKKVLISDWISIGINHHEPSGVPHLHIHLIPRWKHDKGGVIQSLVHNPPQEEREKIAEKIRNA